MSITDAIKKVEALDELIRKGDEDTQRTVNNVSQQLNNTIESARASIIKNLETTVMTPLSSTGTLVADTSKKVGALDELVRKGTVDTQMTIDNVSQQLKTTIESARASIVEELGSNVLKPLSFPDNFRNFCMLASPLAGTGATLPIGHSIGLNALVPTAGGTVQDADKVLLKINESAHISIIWSVRYRDDDTSSWTEARAASSIQEQGAHFQVLNGSFTSVFFEILPWPESSTVEGSPSAKKRQFQISLVVRPWWPGVESLQAIDVGKVEFSVPSWQSVLGRLPEGESSIPVGALDGATSDFHHLRDLFDLKLDNPTPSLGQPSILSLIPKDKSLDGSQRVESILHAAPDIHFQAALDVGAPVQSVLNSIVNAAKSLFGGSSAAGASAVVANTALDVSKVLTGAMNIPIAVDFNGQSIAKTLKPQGDLPLFSLAKTPATSKIAGVLPLGKLLTSIKLSSEDIVPLPVSGKTQFATKHLSAGCGLSILPIPVFNSLDTSHSAKSIDLSIKLQPKLTLPGAKDPVTLNIDLGKISIARPSIALPQVMLMFSDGLSSAVQSDILVALDPATGRQKPSLEVLLKSLNVLLDLLLPLRSLYSSELLSEAISDKSGTNHFEQLLSTTTHVLARLEAATNVTFLPTICPYSSVDANRSTHNRQMLPSSWYSPGGFGHNVSAALYLGLTEVSTYRPFLLIKRARGSAADALSMISFGASGLSDLGTAAVAILSENVATEGAFYYSSRESSPKKLSGSNSFWNDRVAGLQWCDREKGHLPDWPNTFRKIFYKNNYPLMTLSVCLFEVDTGGNAGKVAWEGRTSNDPRGEVFDMTTNPQDLVAMRMYRIGARQPGIGIQERLNDEEISYDPTSNLAAKFRSDTTLLSYLSIDTTRILPSVNTMHELEACEAEITKFQWYISNRRSKIKDELSIRLSWIVKSSPG